MIHPSGGPWPPASRDVSVRLFAGLRERAGAERVEVELPDGATVADLLAAMAHAVGDRPALVRRGDQPRVRGRGRADRRRATRSRSCRR